MANGRHRRAEWAEYDCMFGLSTSHTSPTWRRICPMVVIEVVLIYGVMEGKRSTISDCIVFTVRGLRKL